MQSSCSRPLICVLLMPCIPHLRVVRPTLIYTCFVASTQACFIRRQAGRKQCKDMISTGMLLGVLGGIAEAASRAPHACIASAAQTLAAMQRQQVALLLQILVLDRVLEEDGVTGDAYGPYEKELVAKERERVAREKVLPPLNLKLPVQSPSTLAKAHCSVNVSPWLCHPYVESPAETDRQ